MAALLLQIWQHELLDRAICGRSNFIDSFKLSWNDRQAAVVVALIDNWPSAQRKTYQTMNGIMVDYAGQHNYNI
jgi:hypothetical protein